MLLVAPGRSVLSEQGKVKDYIIKHDAIVIGVNAVITGFDYDYIFFVNQGRYEYANKLSIMKQLKATRILLSNIKIESNANELIIGYNNVIKRGWEHFDNAVICCLRLMDYIGVKDVAIAGFDGFKDSYNESYADPFLPTINPGKKWVELNEEISSMYKDFIMNSHSCKNIEFVTDSIFNTK